jgi:hypothetical protein
MGISPGRRRFIRTRYVIGTLLLGSGLAAANVTASAAAITSGPATVSVARTAAAPARTATSARAATAASAVAAAGASGLVRANVRRATGVQPASAPPTGYAPSDLQSAYNLASAAASAGTSAMVAVIGAYDDPDAASDLAIYRTQYGLPACTVANGCFRQLNQSGQASPLPSSYGGTPDPWATDESLDLDMVSAICPNCAILLVEANNSAIGNTGSAVNSAVALGAKYVIIDPLSGGNDPMDGQYLDHPGVAITAPAGNYGYRQPFAIYPAASQFVTAVGGTTLTRAPGTARGWAETVWGPPPSTAPTSDATSSGCVGGAQAGKPSWQTDTGCANRTANDLAAVADPNTGVAFYDSYQGGAGWGVGGGTTVSAAIVGAVYALAGPPAASTLPVTYPYLHTADLYPVTSGTDAGDGCSPAYLCTAGPGYNGPAGLGTPDGTAAFSFGSQTADYIALASPGLQSHVSVLPYSVNVPALAAVDSASNETITYTATGLPPGVTFDTATGSMSGEVATAFHGTSTITASDPTGAQATVSFSWDVQNSIFVLAPGTPQTQPDTFVSQQISATDEAAGQTLTYTATGLPPGLSINPATGVISGTTSSTIGTYHVTVTATDGTGSTGSTSFTWNVWNLITVILPEIEHFEVGVPVSVQVTATDTATGLPFTFSLAGSGSLPPGLSLDPTTGLISGTPTALGQYTDLIEVTDGTGSQGLATFDWVVAGDISISSPGALSTGAGEPVNEDLSVTDSAAGDTLTYAATGLPPGLLIEGSTPVIFGWTEASGSYTVKVTASDQWGGSGSVSFKWSVPAAPATGPAGPIPLNLGGKCLDDTGNRSTNGNKVQVWTCTGGAAQLWTIARDGTIRIHGKCLDVTGRSTQNGAKLQLWSCTGGLNQAWVPSEFADLQGIASGRCLTDPTAGTHNGTQVQIQTCGIDVPASQQWTLPAGSLLLGVTGKCVDDWGARTTNGNPIQVYTCNGDKAQAWTLEPDGTVRVLGKCLTFGPPSSGGAVTLATCEPPDGDQQWAPSSYFQGIGLVLVAGGPGSGYCLSDPGDSTTNGTRVKVTACPGPLDLGSTVHFW